MARFIMTNRRAGKFLDSQKTASREAVETRFHSTLEFGASDISTPTPPDDLARRVFFFDADPEEVAVKAADFPQDVIVEPEIPHRPVQRWGPPPVGVQATAVLDAIPMAAAAPLVSVRVVEAARRSTARESSSRCAIWRANSDAFTRRPMPTARRACCFRPV